MRASKQELSSSQDRPASASRFHTLPPGQSQELLVQCSSPTLSGGHINYRRRIKSLTRDVALFLKTGRLGSGPPSSRQPFWSLYAKHVVQSSQ
jgi:hypothetical protein